MTLLEFVDYVEVSNILDEWKRCLASPDVQALRELGANLKRIGIDAAQCAKGLGY